VAINLQGACLEFCSVVKIERRPRGASRLKPLLHLLQRAVPVSQWLIALVHGLRLVERRLVGAALAAMRRVGGARSQEHRQTHDKHQHFPTHITLLPE